MELGEDQAVLPSDLCEARTDYCVRRVRTAFPDKCLQGARVFVAPLHFDKPLGREPVDVAASGQAIRINEQRDVVQMKADGQSPLDEAQSLDMLLMEADIVLAAASPPGRLQQSGFQQDTHNTRIDP